MSTNLPRNCYLSKHPPNTCVACIYRVRLTCRNDTRIGSRLSGVSAEAKSGFADFGDQAGIVRARGPPAGAAFSGAADVLFFPAPLNAVALRPVRHA